MSGLWDEVKDAVCGALNNGEGHVNEWYLEHHFRKAGLGVYRLPDAPIDATDGGQPEAAQWLPIETAPKDGREIILAKLTEQHTVEQIDVGQWEVSPGRDDPGGYDPPWSDWSSNYGIEEPTHWLPKPLPPVAADSGTTAVTAPARVPPFHSAGLRGAAAEAKRESQHVVDAFKTMSSGSSAKTSAEHVERAHGDNGLTQAARTLLTELQWIALDNEATPDPESMAAIFNALSARGDKARAEGERAGIERAAQQIDKYRATISSVGAVSDTVRMNLEFAADSARALLPPAATETK